MSLLERAGHSQTCSAVQPDHPYGFSVSFSLLYSFESHWSPAKYAFNLKTKFEDDLDVF